MECSEAKLKSNDDKASPCFRPLRTENVSVTKPQKCPKESEERTERRHASTVLEPHFWY